MTLLEKIIYKVEQQVEKKTHKNNVRFFLLALLPSSIPSLFHCHPQANKSRTTPRPTNNPNSATAHQEA
jgi:hypothetical protein